MSVNRLGRARRGVLGAGEIAEAIPRIRFVD
jgi:hypothetical protein